MCIGESVVLTHFHQFLTGKFDARYTNGVSGMKRLLIVGAGATIEECLQSGNYSNDLEKSFPVIGNFCKKLFQPDSHVLLYATASYLEAHSIQFDSKMLNLKEGDTWTGNDAISSPIGTFLRLESSMPEAHNIERLCEYVWQTFGNSKEIWDEFIYSGIYFKLFAIFTEQFGMGLGVPMLAGNQVANLLEVGDKVINLNYDIAFDLALKQVHKPICYAPDYRHDAISVLKPHGSMNFYVNLENGNCYFEEPELVSGSIGLPDPQGGYFFPHSGFVPPRLNKNYKQHPAAEIILNTDRPFFPKIVSFWGIGLTDSDLDLLAVYREATLHAEKIEFINPSYEAWTKAQSLLKRDITHFSTFDSWINKTKIP